MTQHEDKVINNLPGGTSPIVDRKPQTLDALCTVDSHGTDPMDPWGATFMVGARKLLHLAWWHTSLATFFQHETPYFGLRIWGIFKSIFVCGAVITCRKIRGSAKFQEVSPFRFVSPTEMWVPQRPAMHTMVCSNLTCYPTKKFAIGIHLKLKCETSVPHCTCNILKLPGGRYLVGKSEGSMPQLHSTILGWHKSTWPFFDHNMFPNFLIQSAKHWDHVCVKSILLPITCNFSSTLDSMGSLGKICSASCSLSEGSSPERRLQGIKRGLRVLVVGLSVFHLFGTRLLHLHHHDVYLVWTPLSKGAVHHLPVISNVLLCETSEAHWWVTRII